MTREIDTLAAMHRRGSITAGMREAGERFRIYFRTARLDPLRAVDLTAPRLRKAACSWPKGGGAAAAEARDIVWRTLTAVGPPAGSALWHVVGWERSIKEWTLLAGWNGHPVSQETASGILIAALGMIEQHLLEVEER
jgi:hypothetical protein